jgi:NTP pyrophosphatase (non-canonical NTP hydrolase)
MMSAVLNLTEISIQHHAWVQKMGWHNKRTLESLGLVGTEIVEVQEQILLYQESPLPMKGVAFDEFWARLCEELADVTLRLMDLSVEEGVDLTALAEGAGESVWKSRLADAAIAEVLIDWMHCMNAARKVVLDDDFLAKLGKLARRVMDYARVLEIDLLAHVQEKMARNLQNGTRGRAK